MHPSRPALRQDGVITFRRLRIGNLVLRRRMWVFSPAATLGFCTGSSDAELFLAVNRWRRQHGIPDRIFVAERLQARFDLWPLHKPQYIDFTSPSFIPIFRAALESSKDELKLEEMLPTPDVFPAGEDGRKWAVEAQLESIAFHRLDPWKSQASQSRVSQGQLQIVES